MEASQTLSFSQLGSWGLGCFGVLGSGVTSTPGMSKASTLSGKNHRLSQIADSGPQRVRSRVTDLVSRARLTQQAGGPPRLRPLPGSSGGQAASPPHVRFRGTWRAPSVHCALYGRDGGSLSAAAQPISNAPQTFLFGTDWHQSGTEWHRVAPPPKKWHRVAPLA